MRRTAVLEDGTRAKLGHRPPDALLQLVSEAARRLSPEAPLSRDGVTGMQQTAGNGAVQRLVAVQRNKAKAAEVAGEVKANNGRAPAGYVGGRVFGNHEGRLPAKDGKGSALTYWEYDVFPFREGRNRGAVRVVIDSNWVAWYTRDHYKTFSKLAY
jgi:guanyl-specific ribonuclease Sa